jgi:hypothetical protein
MKALGITQLASHSSITLLATFQLKSCRKFAIKDVFFADEIFFLEKPNARRRTNSYAKAVRHLWLQSLARQSNDKPCGLSWSPSNWPHSQIPNALDRQHENRPNSKHKQYKGKKSLANEPAIDLHIPDSKFERVEKKR